MSHLENSGLKLLIRSFRYGHLIITFAPAAQEVNIYPCVARTQAWTLPLNLSKSFEVKFVCTSKLLESLNYKNDAYEWWFPS